MTPTPRPSRAGSGPRVACVALGLAAALLVPVPPAPAQEHRHAPPAQERQDAPPPAPEADVAAAPHPTIEHFALQRLGRFEVWQDTTLLGTEEYRVLANERGDSVVTASTVRYRLPGRDGEQTFEKRTTLVLHGHGTLQPRLYQSHEVVGAETRAMSTIFADTIATVYRESEGHGVATTMGVPLGRVYVLDPNVYEHVERMVAEFAARGLESRTQNVVVPSQVANVTVKLTRGDEEAVATPEGERRAVRVDVFDDLTLIRTWVDERGRLIRLEAPAQKVRVVRLPDPKADGGAETGERAAR